MKKYQADVLIVGGGIIGAALAYYLSRFNLNIILVEKNTYLAADTTATNSGIIHGGFDAKPNQLKSQLNVAGRKLWEEWFKHLTFPRLKATSLVVAYNKEEEASCLDLVKRGYINGLSEAEVFYLGREKLKLYEAKEGEDFGLNWNCIEGALVCPISWIVDPRQAALTLIAAAIDNGLRVFKGVKVKKIEQASNPKFELEAKAEGIVFEVKRVINAAGAGAASLAKSFGDNSIKVKPRRGQYIVVEGDKRSARAPVIFGVPTTYGKGVLVAPRPDLCYIIGPTAEEDLDFEDAHIVTPKLFGDLQTLGKHLSPVVNVTRLIGSFAGTRVIDTEDGDFKIANSKINPNLINVAAIQSPGLSAAPAIAELVAQNLLNLPLIKKTNFKADYELIC